MNSLIIFYQLIAYAIITTIIYMIDQISLNDR